MEDSIRDLEKLRRKTALHLIITIILSLAVAIICFFIFYSYKLDNRFVLVGPFFIGLGFWFLLTKITNYSNVFYEYMARFKATFVEIPFQNAFSQVFYNFSEGIDQKVIEATGIMCLGNRYYSNDYVEGYYKDVKFIRADVKIEHHYQHKNASYTVTYFDGRWIIFEFNKNFNFDLQIIGNTFSYSDKNNTIFTWAQERRHRIELEDIEFNERFDVFGQDDHEAYYILTPQIMSVLKDLYNIFDGLIMFGFIDNQLHVAINRHRDAMEPSLFSKNDFDLVQRDVQNEINVIILIMEGLDLDRELYKV